MARLAGNLALAGIFSATAASAQPPVAPAAPSLPSAWTASAGYESFWLRDVARARRPVDASPVAWAGDGPALVVTYEREGPGRLHHFDGSIAIARDFSLRSPVRNLDAADDDHGRRLGARYEYRRYPFRNIGVTGLDLGIGVEGDIEHLAFTRHFAPALELQSRIVNFGASAVLAARFNRSRFGLLATFGNGLSIGRESTLHRGDVDTSLHGWGGGWQTNLGLQASIRLNGRTSVMVSYLDSGEGRFASHNAFTFGRSRFTMGATYER